MLPEEFFTWEYLTTYAGAVIAVTVIVQFTKELPGICKIPTRAWAYILSVSLLLLSTVFTVSPITPAVILLVFINAVLVAMAAVGGYDITHKIKTE